VDKIKDTRKTVLIVEDEQDVVDFLIMVLEDAGFRAVFANDAQHGMEKVRSENPDLVSLDIMLPEKSGVKFYRELKSDPVLSKIPVVMVTGVQAEFERFISTRRQVPPPEGYIAKPFDGKKYMETIRKVLAA
jgi:DNA-binding response OmpR family regulator